MKEVVAHTWERKPIGGSKRKNYSGVLITNAAELQNLSKLWSGYGSSRDQARQYEIIAQLLAAFNLTEQVDNRRQAQSPIAEFMGASSRFITIRERGYKEGDYVIYKRQFMRIKKITNAYVLVLLDGAGKSHPPINPLTAHPAK